MKTLKKTLAVLLALILAFSAFGAVSFAADDAAQTPAYTTQETVTHAFYRLLDKLVFALGRLLNLLIPGLNWTGKIQSADSYKSENFYPGKQTFDTAPAEGAGWKMGFAEGSFLDGIDATGGEYNLAGTLEAMEGRAPTEVLDDQGCRAYALSDGETTVVYAAIDGFGFARGDGLEIRDRLADFAKENGIDSINVSALHQHSCIDTLGLATPLVPAVLENPALSLFASDKLLSGRNKTFMESVYGTVVAAIKDAFNSMKDGTLYYGCVDIADYLKDKREPNVLDADFQRLRFIPADGSDEIWVCETGMHPVSLGAGPDKLTSDFPYYLKSYVKEQTGADLVFIQGAELAISSRTETMNIAPGADDAEKLAGMGKALGDRLISIADEEELAPLLNVAHREVFLDVENPVHMLAGREGLLGSTIVKKGLGYQAVTEIGYMELGGKLGILLTPGEIEPAILWGGAADANISWTGDTWDYAPLAETAGVEKLICFGLCNDQIGYILTDNDVRSIFTQNEEINVLNFSDGSILTEAYEALFAAVK